MVIHFVHAEKGAKFGQFNIFSKVMKIGRYTSPYQFETLISSRGAD